MAMMMKEKDNSDDDVEDVDTQIGGNNDNSDESDDDVDDNRSNRELLRHKGNKGLALLPGEPRYQTGWRHKIKKIIV